MLLEDGGMQLQWDLNDGAYNIKNPKSNSDQDYEGNFYEPTEKVNESLFSQLNAVTPTQSIDIGDKTMHYFNDEEFEEADKNFKHPTVKVLHERFINENFDFLKDEEI